MEHCCKAHQSRYTMYINTTCRNGKVYDSAASIPLSSANSCSLHMIQFVKVCCSDFKASRSSCLYFCMDTACTAHCIVLYTKRSFCMIRFAQIRCKCASVTLLLLTLVYQNCVHYSSYHMILRSTQIHDILHYGYAYN
jgi:hypothetical protein